MRAFFQRHSVITFAAIIFSVALFTRTGALKQYVAPDEPSWAWRSINFSRALEQGEWAATAQIGHPGVTTMWLGSLGILLKRLADPAAGNEAIQWLNQITTLAPENAEAFKRLGVFLTYGRLPVIFVNALGVVVISARASFVGPAARSRAAFRARSVAAGLSGLLHVDGC
jgi:hypothetical protein